MLIKSIKYILFEIYGFHIVIGLIELFFLFMKPHTFMTSKKLFIARTYTYGFSTNLSTRAQHILSLCLYVFPFNIQVCFRT